jgi:hypothetical protein
LINPALGLIAGFFDLKLIPLKLQLFSTTELRLGKLSAE